MRPKIQPLIISDSGGQIPPQCKEIEEAILGSALVDDDIAKELVSLVKPEMFYNLQHQEIYRAIYEMSLDGKRSDMLSVMAELRRKNLLEEVGGAVYLVDLSSKIVTTHGVEDYAKILVETYSLREQLVLSTRIQQMVYGGSSLTEINEFAENEIFRIAGQSQTKEPKRIDKCVDELLITVKKIVDNPRTLIGIPSGMSNVDRITGGWQKGNLIILAARVSQGKSALASVFAHNAALTGHPVAFFSLEMSEEELTTRYMNGASGFTNVQIRGGKVDYNKFVNASEKIAKLPIFIDDTPNISIPELRSKAKKLVLKYGVEMIVVDYLQLMRGEGQSREQEVAYVSRGLKGMAKELSIPIIALAQINREVESRADKRPSLAMLRESGSIESDSDIVGMIYRPAVYGIEFVTVHDSEGTKEISSKSLMMFDIQKNRHGATCPVPLWHNETLTVISDNIDDINQIPF